MLATENATDEKLGRPRLHSWQSIHPSTDAIPPHAKSVSQQACHARLRMAARSASLSSSLRAAMEEALLVAALGIIIDRGLASGVFCSVSAALLSLLFDGCLSILPTSGQGSAAGPSFIGLTPLPLLPPPPGPLVDSLPLVFPKMRQGIIASSSVHGLLV